MSSKGTLARGRVKTTSPSRPRWARPAISDHGAPLGDLGHRLLAIAADHGVGVGTRLQPVARILRRRPPPQDRHHARRQGVDVVANPIKVLRPVDGITDQIGLRSEEPLRAGRPLMAEVDQLDPLGIGAERGGHVLQPQGREGCLGTPRMPIRKDAQDVAEHNCRVPSV